MLADFGRFILIFNKMALIFLGVLIIVTISSFELQQVLLPDLTAKSLMTNAPKFSQLDYQIWGQCWSLHKCYNKSHKMLSYRKETALQGALCIVFAKSRRLEVGDNILRTLYRVAQKK